MTHSPNNPDQRPLGEDQILDLVEGRLSEQEQQRLLVASGRAGLGDRVRQMQANRRALASVADERAPRQLAERVLATLERDALLGLAQGEHADPNPPIQISDHLRGGGVSRWSRAVPSVALAAGVLLLIAGGAYWSTLLIGGKQHTVANGPIAIAPPVVAPTVEATRTANATPREEAPAPAAAAKVAAADLALSAPAPVSVPTYSPAEAAELAKQGRLVIRVAATSTRALAQLETMGNGKNHRTWRLHKDVPAAVSSTILAAVTARPASPDFVGPALATSDPASIAAAIAPLVGPRAAFNIAPPRIEHAGGTIAGSYLLELPADAQSVDSMTTMLADRLKGDVRLEALPEPVDAGLTPDPESLMWWTQSPQNWTPRATVPLVIEERD